MSERLKTHSKTQKKSADLVSNKLRIGVFQRYQMKCKSVSKKSPRYTLLGVLVITLIGNGLVLLGINSFFQQVVRGVIIVVAVLANILLTQRSSKAKR